MQYQAQFLVSGGGSIGDGRLTDLPGARFGVCWHPIPAYMVAEQTDGKLPE